MSKAATDWYPLSRPVGDLLNVWADRNDLLAYLGPDRGDATAFCDLVRGEIEANTDLLYKGFEMEEVVRHGADNFRKFPIATGALYHEAMHARHTPRKDLSKVFSKIKKHREMHVLAMLEEPRIEYNGIKHDEKMQRYLRASGLRVAIGEKKDQDDRSPIDMMPLSLGRVYAGSLREKDVKKIRAMYVEHLTEEVVAKGEALMEEFVYLEDNDHETMYRIVRDWCALMPEETPEDDDFDLQDLLDAMNGAAAEAGSGAMEDLDEDARKEKRAARDKERWDKANRQKEADKAKDEKRDPKDMKYGGGSYGRTGSVPFTERKPTSEERAAAVRLSNILARVEYSEKIRHHVESEVPPGRPNMRRIVNNRGAKAAGSTARPLPEWEMLRRETVPSPTLRVGLIVDVSGSMSRAMGPMAVTAYVLSTALHRIQAKASVNYMGGMAYTAKQHPDVVQTWEAAAGWENFKDAKALLDSDIGLTLNENGARLGIIVSDGQYQHDQKEAAREWMRLLKRQGASVLWVGYGSHGHAEAMCREVGAEFLPMKGTESPAEVATAIGNIAVRVLQENKR